MTFKKPLSPFMKSIWQIFAIILISGVTFTLYVYSQKQISKANELRLQSFILADELRQSSDDLTRMVRTYIATKNPLYKTHYQEILDIRNGKKMRPAAYQHIYWDLVGLDDKRPTLNTTQAISLIDRMHKVGFTDNELVKLTQSKKNSDTLTKIEFTAMKLIEMKGSKLEIHNNEHKALKLLNDENYHKLKASIMRPLNEFYSLMKKRTSSVVHKAEMITFSLRIIFILLVFLLFFMLWRLHKILHQILGSNVDTLHKHILNIGKGNLSVDITVEEGLENSILGWLKKTQIMLKEMMASNQRLTQLYAVLSQCNQAIVRSTNEDELFTIICRDAINFGGMKMATIGMADENNQEIKPVAFYGEGLEYLDDLLIILHPDNPLGKGPIGSAFTQNKPIWCQDFVHDTISKPWHEKAKVYGWGSVASLPLHRNGKTVGTFTLYAHEVNAFDESAQKLLLEMTTDIDFALDNFDKEALRKDMQLSLEAEKNIAQNYLDIAGVMILVLDVDKKVQLINRRGCEIIGYSADEVIGENWMDNFIPQRFRNKVEDVNTSLIKPKQSKITHFENPILRKDGQERMIAWSNTTLFDTKGNIIGLLTSGEDITDRLAAEEKNHYLAYYDSLTGLPNRMQLDEHVRYALSLAKRSNEALAVMFLDLDHFKDINDTLGHNIGDKLLIELAKRLQSAIREEDIVARMGGDEFIILLPSLKIVGAADNIAQKLLEVMKQAFKIDSYELSLTASIGIALYPNDGQDFETLYKNADTAMYRAKQGGRNGYSFFTQEMQKDSIRHLEFSNALHHALKEEEFELYYQPQVSSVEGKIIGVEALIRWHHPKLGLVSPAEFIPIAEENGLILPLGEWILRTAVKQAKEWINQGAQPIIMAVNLSSVQFKHIALQETISNILQEFDLPPEYLELELTEGVAMNNPLEAIDIMNELHNRGIRMSIDDFGTGYSSLSYLKQFKIYKLKIDQSFVRDINIDDEDKAIVSAVIVMAKRLGLQTIAEGVETIGQLEYLKEQGCDEIQGYFYSKPLPAKEFEAFRNTHVPNS